jgi:hypothetical protein
LDFSGLLPENKTESNPGTKNPVKPDVNECDSDTDN